MSPRPPKGNAYAMVGLPNVPPGVNLDPSVTKHLQDLNVVLQREFESRSRKGEATEITLLSPDGSLWRILVDDAGGLSTEKLFSQS